MNFEMKDFLESIGPTASLVFAAWIFLSFLQQRYIAAFERFRELTNEFRSGGEGDRRRSVRAQVRLYSRRCKWMMWATNVGVVSAILLITTLILGGLNVVFPAPTVLPPIAAVCAFAGLGLVIVAAVIVLVENTLVGQALQADIADMPELEDGRPGRSRP